MKNIPSSFVNPSVPTPVEKHAGHLTRAKRFLAGCSALVGAWASAQVPLQTLPPGPPAQTAKIVVFIASDYRNGGVMGVYRGFEEASQKLGWKIRIEDGGGSKATQASLLTKAVADRPHGIVFGGFEPDGFVDQVAGAKQNRIILIGWHAAKEPGPTKELLVNISTKPVDVAKIAANFVIQDAIANQQPLGVVLFNDNQYAVANAKT
jgi:ribose transport system substrate-binding protein